VRLDVWPHTTSGGWCYLNFTSKQFAGTIDVIFGFDRETQHLKKFQVYSPHTVTEYFNENIPDYYYLPGNASEWTYQIETSEGKVSGRKLSSLHVFYAGSVEFYHKNPDPVMGWDLIRKISFNILDNRLGQWKVYWQVDTLVLWMPAKEKLDFEHKVFRYQGMTDWFMLTVDVVKNQIYHARFWLDILPKIDGEYGKYWVAIKKHSDTILEAIQNKRFYALDPWWNSNWQYKVKLTIDQTKIDADLTHFPVTIFFDSGNMNWSNIQDDLDDFRFVDSTESNVLSAELESYTVNTNAIIHCAVEAVDDAVNIDFYCYFGNPTAASAWDAEGVWDSNFVMVQHMTDATTSTILDSTSFSNDGTKKAANEPILTSSGKIDGAQSFDGINDYISVADVANLDVGGALTVSLWVKLNMAQDGKALLIHDLSEYKYLLYLENSAPKIYIRTTSGISNRGSGININDGGLHYCVGLFDKALGSSRLTIIVDNNIPISANAYAEDILDGDQGLHIGSFYNSLTGGVNGTEDELRLSNIRRSAAWVKAEYYSGMDGLLAYGSESEFLPPSIGEFQAPEIVYPSKSTFLNVTARYDTGRTNIKNVTLELEGGIELLWNETSKAFSETADPSDYFTLDTASTYVELNATAYQVCFKGSFSSSYPEGYITGIADVATDDEMTAGATETDWFLFSTPPFGTASIAFIIAIVAICIALVYWKKG